MPVSFLTENERHRLTSFPAEIPEGDIVAYFTLTPGDLEQLPRTAATHNRLGFAVQLGACRYLGFCPDLVGEAPPAVVAHVATQLGLPAEGLGDYAAREQTRTDHARRIHEYLGFRRLTREQMDTLRDWLVDRAVEHDRPLVLVQLLCERLRAGRLMRPPLNWIERIVSGARQAAEQRTYRLLSPLLDDERRQLLDSLLTPESGTSRTPLNWLRQGASRSSSQAIVEAIEKLAQLSRWRVDTWGLDILNPNRRKLLAEHGRKASPQAMRRMPDHRRYPTLLAFLHQRVQDLTDEVIEMFDRRLADGYARARREFDALRLGAAHSTGEKVRLLHDVGSIVLDNSVEDAHLRKRIYERIAPNELRLAVKECARLTEPRHASHITVFALGYSNLRQFTPGFVDALRFRSNLPEHPLLKAIDTLRTRNARPSFTLPKDAPLEFVPASWRRFVVREGDIVLGPYYELCALWQLRAALRAGEIWVENSRRYANPEGYLIPEDRWSTLRTTTCELLGLPAEPRIPLRERQEELERLSASLERALPESPDVRLDEHGLVISPTRALERPSSLEALEEEVAGRLPLVELSDLLLEVDAWTGFSSEFVHAGGARTRSRELNIHCHASLLAQACNFGLTRMAQMADIPHSRLLWCSAWYLREETLRRANTRIVNFQYHQPLAGAWGGGTLSSSDGQRFPVAVPSRTATALPRYFGFGRGLAFYTWTSDQYSQYGSKPIPATLRDATVVLDEILDNETELPIVEHTTDTAGYSDLIFGLFDLLGLQFSPRLRDVGSLRLYRMPAGQPARQPRTQVASLLKRAIRPRLIEERWDDLLRITGSLKLGWVTASLLIAKLQSSAQQNPVALALQEYGRIPKTIFILRWLQDPAFRRRIGAQLNKGEALHGLRRFLVVAFQGHVRQSQQEGQLNQVACLNLVANAIIVWNRRGAPRRADGRGAPFPSALRAHQPLRPRALRSFRRARSGYPSSAPQGTMIAPASGYPPGSMVQDGGRNMQCPRDPAPQDGGSCTTE